MLRFFALPCLAFLFAALALNAQELPLFPSNRLPIELKSKDGETITAIIHDVWPDRQSARIFVEERGDTFTIPFDLLDEESMTKLQDWFYKRLIKERVSIRNEELPADDDRGSLMNPQERNSGSGTYRDRQSVSTNQRKRKIISSIYNSSPYVIDNLHVVYGVYTSTNIRDTGSSKAAGKPDAFYSNEQKIKQLKPHEELKLSTPTILLNSVSITYYTTRTVTLSTGGTYDEQIRRNRQENDRISGSYTLIYYKNELVAGVATRNSLVGEALQYRKAKAPPPPDTRRYITVTD